MEHSVNATLPHRISSRLKLPLIVAPMLRVSGPDLVIASCRAGAIGAFPTANARSPDELDHWLARIAGALAEGEQPCAPYCPNLIIRSSRLKDDLACLVRHRVELVITSVGSPAPVIPALHDIGCLVFADVATMAHARKAMDAGADGLVLLTAGAGGQTGWLNGFAFARAVRAIFPGPIVLAGGICDGHALRAARVLGCDLAYMGTTFIATRESMASQAYKEMLVNCDMDDVLLTRAFTGLPANMLRPSITRAGLDPDRLDEDVSLEAARERYGGGTVMIEGPRRWTDIWSAGHSVSGVDAVMSVRELVDQIADEYTRTDVSP
ncbi:NAD(P)H-dependent flavin oxidoreductase [Rhodoligotrophos defluvii]|uniref:NAD(P)H-dependent flavin oxidoreductase n=1 Tax=Rhodoligotrophos defluvii TaxID=2561934 RepID=UPI003D16B05F